MISTFYVTIMTFYLIIMIYQIMMCFFLMWRKWMNELMNEVYIYIALYCVLLYT